MRVGHVTEGVEQAERVLDLSVRAFARKEAGEGSKRPPFHGFIA